MKNVYVIGVGLIGGSLALDIKAKDSNSKIFGIDINNDHLDTARELGVIDQNSNYDGLVNADLVIVSIPVDKAVEEIPKILDAISDDTLVIDVGSTKFPICAVVKGHPRRRNFLATHPIAGTE
ncbi:MAG: prephenate dehydrogenase/arogenate dehydrogenase family protein, partial [Psychroserpens sp.]|nr:prephenate dehydrogenase/arogenate dehydrogenase family protein [Psychroserpens sp.]